MAKKYLIASNNDMGKMFPLGYMEEGEETPKDNHRRYFHACEILDDSIHRETGMLFMRSPTGLLYKLNREGLTYLPVANNRRLVLDIDNYRIRVGTHKGFAKAWEAIEPILTAIRMPLTDYKEAISFNPF